MSTGTSYGAGGGGATHIAITNRGVLSKYSSYRSEVLIVAGGSGGSQSMSNISFGGSAGGGNNGASYAFGVGASGSTMGTTDNVAHSGAGGGWYGGSVPRYGAGGGSGYIDGVPTLTLNGIDYSPSTTTGGASQTHGSAKITYLASNDNSTNISTSVDNGNVNINMSDIDGIIQYQITENNSVPTEWIEIDSTIYTKIDYQAPSIGTYYIWVKDANGNVSNQAITVSYVSTCPYNVGQAWNYAYTGGVQTFTTPCNGTYKLEVWGSQGGSSVCNGSSGCARGGYGGYAVGSKVLNSNSALYIVVGEAGCTPGYNSYGCGGYNGGGNASGDYHDDEASGGGGGATHIATVNRGILPSFSSYQNEVLIVAGGGGGASWSNIGNSGGGTGGGGSFGQGSHGNGGGGGSNGMPGGGGGWSGGCNGNGNDSGGQACGGSGYIGGVTNGSMQNGVRSGNGYAKITLVSISQ